MLFNDEHEDSKDQLGGQEDLEEQGLGDRDTTIKGCGGIKAAAWHKAVGEARRCEAAKQLGNDDENETDEIDATCCEHGDGYGRVEHATSDAEESPMMISFSLVQTHAVARMLITDYSAWGLAMVEKDVDCVN